MTQSSSPKTVRRGRVFPEKQLSPEEKARIETEDAVFYKRCREVFERVQPELIQEHYDWFLIIEPDIAILFESWQSLLVTVRGTGTFFATTYLGLL